jgi:hypothetical protein
MWVSPVWSDRSESVYNGGSHLHDTDDRAKRLLAHDVHRVVDIDQHLRRDVRRAVLGGRELGLIDQRPGAGLDGVDDLGPDALGRLHRDDGAEGRRLLTRVAEDIVVGDLGKLGDEVVVD